MIFMDMDYKLQGLSAYAQLVNISPSGSHNNTIRPT